MIVTGAGAGLGRAYSFMYGKLGANVVVNDVSEKGANVVVDEIVKGWFHFHLTNCSIDLGTASWWQGRCSGVFGRRR